MVNHSALGGVRAQRQVHHLPLRVATLLVIILLATTGCAAPSVSPGAGSPGSSHKPAVSTPTLPITFWHPAPSLSLATAWGNVTITRLPSALPNGEIFNGGDVATPDGQWLIGEVEPRDMLTNQTIYPQIALYNIHTQRLRIIHTLRSPQSRLDDISTDGRWLAWNDAVDPGTFFDWIMYLCDLQTGVVRVLARAPQVNGQAAPGPHAGPFVSNGHIVWSQPTAPVTQGDLNSLKHVVVQIEDLSSGLITTLANSASAMAFSWPWVSWGQIGPTGTGSVLLQNTVTRQRQQLKDEPNAFGLDGASAVLEDNNNEVEVIPDVARSMTPQTVFATDPAKHIQTGYPTISDRLVAWRGDASNPTPVVWDRVLHVTVTLPTTNVPQSSEAYTSGTLLIWFDPAEPAAQQKSDEAQGLSPLETYCIVNTTQLPTTPPNA